MSLDVLSNLLSVDQPRMQAWLAAWQASGASGVGVDVDADTYVLWSKDTDVLLVPSLRSTLAGPHGPIAELWLSGLADPVSQARLCADASTFSALLHSEIELDAVTQDLVETQDQLLALYKLNRSLRHHNTVQEALHDLAGQTAQMMKSRHAFAVVIKTNDERIVVQYPEVFGPPDYMCACAMQADMRKGVIRINKSDFDIPGFASDSALVASTRLRSGELVALGWCGRFVSEFGSPEIKLAQALVEQAGARIENVLQHEVSLARTRINTELESARRIQQKLLPSQALHVPGLHIAAITVPAYEMGGDFYDYAIFSGRWLTFCVGDVSGKGLAAASLMSIARTSIRTHSRYMFQPSPAAVLNRSNEDLEADFGSAGMFATVFSGHYLFDEARLLFANAGHSPVFYKAMHGPIRMLNADGPPLGVLSDLGCVDECIDVAVGDVLLVASDGFPEAVNEVGEMYGYDRLASMVEASASLPSKQILGRVLEGVQLFAGGQPQADDQTLIVMKRIA